MSAESCGLRCELVTDFSRLQSLAPAWERLNRESCGSAFQSWGWASAFWKTHGLALTLCAPVIFAGDAVVGIVPLVIRDGTVRLLGEPYADYNGPLCLPEHALNVLDTALTALLDGPFSWTECVFNNLPGNSPLMQSLKSSEWRLRRHFQAVFQYSCPTVREDGTGVFERLARKQSLRRHENGLRRQGNLAFRHLKDRREIQGHLDEFFRQHATRQALNGIRSQFLDSAPRAMMRALVEELDPVHELRFSALELDGRALAYTVGFQHAGKFLCYVPSFDVNCWDDSPGEVLLRNLFKYAQKEKLAEFDFTIGDEAYKDRFANHVRNPLSVYFYRSPRQPRVQLLRAGRSLRDIAHRNQRTTEIARWAKQTVNCCAQWLRPAAILRSAADAFGRVFAVKEETVCSRMWAVRDATGAQVRRAGLRDLARLKIQNAINQNDLQSLRRRLRESEEALYLVSSQKSEYLFWLRETGEGTDNSACRIIFEASTLARRDMLALAEALAALLCDRQGSSQICIEVPRSFTGAVNEALHQAGYGMHSRRLQIFVLGRSIGRFPRPAMGVLKEKECDS
jgi:CelD/BcsL family acetyltransferase involved in cellulose biosynthesis